MPVSMNTKFAYVALFDILGFSDLVKKNELTKVTDTYSRATAVFEELLGHVNSMNKSFNMDIVIERRSFSDTFLMYTSKTDDRALLSLLTACDGLFIGAIENKLLLRGAITQGEIIVQTGVEIGRSIVDAYESEQLQDWSGCWVTDQCLSDIDLSTYFADKTLVQYEIPLKNGIVNTYVAFNWVKSLARKAMFENKNKDIEAQQILEELSFMNAQHTDWAIRRKLDNTKRFMEFVLSTDFINAYKNG
jgi:hypothetical protein